VFDSSVHQIIPKPTYLGYACSKAAIGHMTSTLALEYAGNDQIRAHPPTASQSREIGHIACRKADLLPPVPSSLTQTSPHNPLHTNLSPRQSLVTDPTTEPRMRAPHCTLTLCWPCADLSVSHAAWSALQSGASASTRLDQGPERTCGYMLLATFAAATAAVAGMARFGFGFDRTHPYQFACLCAFMLALRPWSVLES
jgi:hypothetical protein